MSLSVSSLQPLWCIVPRLRRAHCKFEINLTTQGSEGKEQEAAIRSLQQRIKQATSQLSKHATTIQTSFLSNILAILQFTTWINLETSLWGSHHLHKDYLKMLVAWQNSKDQKCSSPQVYL